MTVMLPPRTDEPQWVRSWRAAREVGDFRLFVEQLPALAEDGVPIPAAAFTDEKVWVQPGQYGYELCTYDFAAPPDHNRLCAMHPDQPTSQPLKRTLIGGIAFILCLDCSERYYDRQRASEVYQGIPEYEPDPF